MAARIVVRANLSRLVAQDDDALLPDCMQKIITPVRDLRLAPDADPSAREDALEFLREQLG
jgi:hypothetical protein